MGSFFFSLYFLHHCMRKTTLKVLPGGDLCDVAGVQDAAGREGVGGEGGALTLHWIFD